MGMLIVYVVRPKKLLAFKLILAFSGAFLLGITIFHLMPEVFSQYDIQPGPWIVGGLLLQIVLEYLSQGAEHGRQQPGRRGGFGRRPRRHRRLHLRDGRGRRREI